MTESVWDYPRPPALDPVRQDIVITLGGQLIARADRRDPGAGNQPSTHLLPTCVVFCQGSTRPR